MPILSIATSILVCGLAYAQTSPDFEARKTAAYQKFHHGEVHQAARDIRLLANQTNNKATKAYLLRDLTEICAAAFEVNCTLEAENEAFEIASSEQALKPLIPELYSYLIGAQVWLGNKEALQTIFKDDMPPKFNPAQNAPAAASANLAATIYFMRANNHRAAEGAYSTAVMSLLLIDPKNQYAISKILVDMIESLIVQQDIVGASSLLRVADPYLTANLNHDGPYWAKYAYLGAQLAAFTTRNLAVIPALAESSRLNSRQDINEGVKTYRLATSNSLQSLTLLLNGKLDEALALHAQHPLAPQKDAIIDRGAFDSYQEFFFAVSDIMIEDLRGEDTSKWKPLFEKPTTKWELAPLEFRNMESYRNFALGVLASRTSKAAAAELFQLAARQRIDNFEEVLKRKFEGFQLPTSIDFLVIEAALTSMEDYPPPDRSDLMLKGSEMLLRTLRHQISDFAVLIGSQPSERLRANARSYNLLVQQKRSWELQQIRVLLGNESRNVGSLITTYCRRTLRFLASHFRPKPSIRRSISRSAVLKRRPRMCGLNRYPQASEKLSFSSMASTPTFRTQSSAQLRSSGILVSRAPLFYFHGRLVAK